MRTAPVLAVVSVAVTALVATTGCAYLLFGPCGMYGCPRTYVTSLPPHDNPLALALSTPVEADRVERVLNAVVNAQSSKPANASCAEAVVAGCRYSILLQKRQMGPTVSVETPGCSVLDVTVEARTLSGPRIGPLRYRPAACPGAIPPARPPE